uniref:Transmembrane protein 26a n=1 Tax=Cynoglossus semilaevis TaxID=244447 RepID=A0A3P8V126_CYNSE
MTLLRSTCAITTRALFILVCMCAVWRVTSVKEDLLYWFLLLLLLPLVLEMIFTLKRRRGEDYKWFSPPIFLFLISIVPSIWLLELHPQQQIACRKLDSFESVRTTFMVNTTFGNYSTRLKAISTVCSNDWILALHQIVLILLIVGKWLLPRGGGVTREELSQLLLIFIGTAADILEFTSETLSDVKEKTPQMVYLVLAVWTWSMLQFPFHLSVVSNKSESEDEQRSSFFTKHSTDMWNTTEALFIQDGPFLVVRVTAMVYCKIFHQMLGFFTIKNLLVVILSLYRLVVLCQDYRASSSSSRDFTVP